MNVKDYGIVPAIIVGVIAAGASVFFSSTSGRGDTTVAALAKLETQVSNLNQQIQELKAQPYVTRNEYQAGLATTENRLSGLTQRVDAITGRVERVEVKR
jgi:outer membrane murein-binding lipoprotein Lpp